MWDWRWCELWEYRHSENSDSCRWRKQPENGALFFFLFCFSSVGICSNWFSLWIFVSVVAFTSFSLTTHRNNSKIDDFHQLAESASLAYPNQLYFIWQYFRYNKTQTHVSCYFFFFPKIWGSFKSLIIGYSSVLAQGVFSLDFLAFLCFNLSSS